MNHKLHGETTFPVARKNGTASLRSHRSNQIKSLNDGHFAYWTLWTVRLLDSSPTRHFAY